MDMDRLIKILGMTGSSHDGEALAALRMAQKLMSSHGKTWKDLIGAPQPQQGAAGAGWDPFAHAREKAQREAQRQREREEYARARENAHAREQARQRESSQGPEGDEAAMKRECLRMLDECPHLLTDWEKEFLESFKDRPDHWAMSDKQRAVFERILARYRKQQK
jgi:hypothetical protein